MPRRTKIVATLGPATDSPEILDAILRAGVDVVRINFSHGTGEEQLRRIARLRESASRVGKPVAVLADLPGPKLRVRLTEARVLSPGDRVRFSLSDTPGDAADLVLTEPEVLHDVRPGQRMLLDDGRLQLEAMTVRAGCLEAKVAIGGVLLPNKGLNLPDTPLTIASVTPRDRAALEVAAKAGVDWVAVSFVRSAAAAAEVRRAMAEVGLDAPVLAKIERPEAVDHVPTIVAAFDAVMVARGDLGVELPLERVPTVQKRVIAEARAAGKPVITATDMLDSMRSNPRPTRAEASDVAHAIFDGTDAVMLSGETAVGKYPVESVDCMHRIAMEAEECLHRSEVSVKLKSLAVRPSDLEDPITLAACTLAREIDAAAIVAPTVTGRTADFVARYRPWARIIATSPSQAVLRRLALVWGVQAVAMTGVSVGHDRIDRAIRDAFQAGAVRIGETIIVIAGHPIEGGPKHPTIRVVRVGPDGQSEEP